LARKIGRENWPGNLPGNWTTIFEKMEGERGNPIFGGSKQNLTLPLDMSKIGIRQKIGIHREIGPGS